MLGQQPNYQQQNSQMQQQLTQPVYLLSIKPVQQQHTFMSAMRKFMVKKYILKLRLSKFTNTPGTFVSWKTTFQSILQELEVLSLEELDLLQQYLRPESGRYAVSIRAANLHNPARGVETIWERLNDKSC